MSEVTKCPYCGNLFSKKTGEYFLKNTKKVKI